MRGSAHVPQESSGSQWTEAGLVSRAWSVEELPYQRKTR